MAPDVADRPAARWRGLSTSGYAVEGGCNGPGEPANDWVQWERSGLVPPSGDAADFWRHPEPLLDRAASLGCDAFGLSVEWSRIEPEEGRIDGGALDRYAEVLALCEARGLSPVVTLHHQVHPWWLGEEYWLTPGSPDRFAAHAARVVERLGDRCRRWVTVHEPNLRAAAGWVAAAEPPARVGAVSDAWAVVDNLLTAHVLAYEAVHAVQPDAEVAVAPRASSVYDLHELLVDLLLARHLGVARQDLDHWVARRRAAHDRELRPSGLGEALVRAAAAATSPFGTRVRALRRPSPRRAVAAVYGGVHERPLDAVAVSWQQPVPNLLFRAPAVRGTGRGPLAAWVRPPWEVPPDPGGLSRWCRRQAGATPDLPRWVLDDGLATDPGGHRPDGWDRARYLRAQLAAADGASYLYRSVVDGYAPDGSRRGLDEAAAQAFRSLAAAPVAPPAQFPVEPPRR